MYFGAKTKLLSKMHHINAFELYEKNIQQTATTKILNASAMGHTWILNMHMASM